MPTADSYIEIKRKGLCRFHVLERVSRDAKLGSAFSARYLESDDPDDEAELYPRFAGKSVPLLHFCVVPARECKASSPTSAYMHVGEWRPISKSDLVYGEGQDLAAARDDDEGDLITPATGGDGGGPAAGPAGGVPVGSEASLKDDIAKRMEQLRERFRVKRDSADPAAVVATTSKAPGAPPAVAEDGLPPLPPPRGAPGLKDNGADHLHGRLIERRRPAARGGSGRALVEALGGRPAPSGLLGPDAGRAELGDPLDHFPERERDRRRRSRSRRRRRPSSRTSSGSSETSRGFRGARGSMKQCLRETMESRPGRITEKLLGKIKRYLPPPPLGTESPTRPVVETYLTTQLIPKLGQALQVRNEAELRLLAAALDAILRRDLPRAADLLSCQFKAVELAQREGNWHAAKHLNPVADATVSALDEEEKERLYRQEKTDLKHAKLASDFNRRGGSPARAVR